MTQLVSSFRYILCILQLVSGAVVLNVFVQNEPPIVCVRDEPVTITGTGTAHAGLLLYFDGRVVSGGSVADDGTFALTLRVGDEQDGMYAVVVRERDTLRPLQELTCQVQATAPSPTARPPTATPTNEVSPLVPEVEDQRGQTPMVDMTPFPESVAGGTATPVLEQSTAMLPTQGSGSPSTPTPRADVHDPITPTLVVESMPPLLPTMTPAPTPMTQAVSITVVLDGTLEQPIRASTEPTPPPTAMLGGVTIQVIDAFGTVLIDTVTVAHQPLVFRDTWVPGAYRAVVLPRYGAMFPLTETNDSFVITLPVLEGNDHDVN